MDARFGDLKKKLKAELVRLIDELFDRAAYGLGIIDVVLINSFSDPPFSDDERDLDFHQHKFCSELCQMANGKWEVEYRWLEKHFFPTVPLCPPQGIMTEEINLDGRPSQGGDA